MRRQIRRALLGGLLLIGLLYGQWANAQEKKVENPMSGGFALNQDSFFGSWPQVFANYKLRDDFGLAVIATYWSIGSTPWSQIDLGFNKTLFDKRLTISPFLGWTNGSYQSSRSFFGHPAPVRAFESVVPAIYIDWYDGLLEGEFYMGYYKATRSTNFDSGAAFDRSNGGAGTVDFLFWWLYGGVQVHEHLSLGAHYEEFTSVRDSAPGAQGTSLYRWMGPYVELKLASGMTFRVTTGHDFASNDDFFKLRFVKTF